MGEKRKQNWSIRKTKTIVGSVLLGTSICFGTAFQETISAEEVNVTPATGVVESDLKDQTRVNEATEVINQSATSTTNGMTYFENESKNVQSQQVAITKEETDESCVKTVTKTTTATTTSSEFEATAEIDSDGNTVQKVKSPVNSAHDHTNPTYAEQYGPIDFEWNPKYGNNDTYRLNFGTNYAIENAKLTITLPVDGYEFAGDATDWLVNRYYNNSNGKSNYDYLMYFVKDKTNEEIAALNALSERVVYAKSPVVSSDKTVIIDLGTLPARTAFSLQFSRDNTVLGQIEHDKGPIAKLTGSFVLDKGIVLPSYTQQVNALSLEDTRESGSDTVMRWQQKNTQTLATGETTAAGEVVVTKNGYEYEVKTTTEITRKDLNQCGCDKEITTTEVTNRFKFNAESVMDPTLPDYSNTGYLTKVANGNNHPNVTEGSVIEGPGNAEMQHWQTTANGITTQYWRPVLAVDYAVQNGKWTITLPYEVTKEDITDASVWLTEHFYPTMSQKQYYSNYGVLTGTNVLDKLMINGNQVTVDLGDMPARTALALVISKTFETPEGLASNPYKASYVFEGQWQFQDIKLPTTKVVETIDCSCECTPNTTSETPTPTSPTQDRSEIPTSGTATSETKHSDVLPSTGDNANETSVMGSLLLVLGLFGLRKNVKKRD